jgi:hypothetical protein
VVISPLGELRQELIELALQRLGNQTLRTFAQLNRPDFSGDLRV